MDPEAEFAPPTIRNPALAIFVAAEPMIVARESCQGYSVCQDHTHLVLARNSSFLGDFAFVIRKRRSRFYPRMISEERAQEVVVLTSYSFIQ